MRDTPRIPPLPAARWDESTRRALMQTLGRVAVLEGRGPADDDDSEPLNILSVIAHHPRLLTPFLGFASALSVDTALSRREAELLALRAAWNCRSAFEWGHHAQFARAAGLSDEEIARVADGASAPGWQPVEAALLRASDELHDGADISNETWKELAAHYDKAQLLEVVFNVGQYTMLSMLANSIGVPIEEGLDPMPQGGP